MLIEQSAHASRWRLVSPAAKGLFALGGFVAAFAAPRPSGATAVAAVFFLVTVFGARTRPVDFLRVATPPLGFLLLGALSLACSLSLDANNELVVQWLPSGWLPLQQLVARSCGALAAMLFLALSTPMTDLIVLLRRLRVPETLLELMVLCYRMLFVFSQSMHDTRTAQASRLGYATPRLAMRSLGSLAANLTLQIWQRAHDLHIAAQSRNNDGPLRFLEPVFRNVRRDVSIAALGCALVIAASLGLA